MSTQMNSDYIKCFKFKEKEIRRRKIIMTITNVDIVMHKIYANSVQGDGEIGLLLALLHIWAKHECSLSLNTRPLSKCEFQLDDWIQALVIMGEDWLDVHIGQS